MATFSSDKPVKKEEEVRSEEADSAKTTEEEEEEVRTEEAERREEASESLLDFDSINSRLSVIMEDEESDKGAEIQRPQEDSTMMQRSDQTMERGFTSFAYNQNRHLPPQNRSTAQMSQVMKPLEEQIPRSDQTVSRGSATFSTDHNRRLAPQVMMPVEEQIPRAEHQTVNHGSTTFSSGSLETQSPFQHQQRLTTDQNLSFGTQQQLFPTMVTTQQPGWFIRDHSSASAWRPQILVPSVDHLHPMANQLANIDGLQNQTFVPRPLFRPAQTNFVEQPHLNAIALSMYRYYPYMRPEANHLNLRMPHFRSDLMFTLASPSGQPRSFVLLHDQFNPQRFVLSLDDALVYGPILEMDHPQPEQRQHLDFPIDMIHRRDSPSAVAAAAPPPPPRLQLNHQQTQQRFNQGQHFGFPIDRHQASPNAAAAQRQLNQQ
ncbi:hypothetical protein Bca4012_019061 [Brassica carinata]